jgi:RNA polymerase sigma factor (sigma-70 family)
MQNVADLGCAAMSTTIGMSKPHPQTDFDLVERCLKGEQTAWNELVKRYQRLVYSVAGNLAPTREDAADIFQQVWMELYRRLPEVRNVQALPAWLITVTRRTGFAQLREKISSIPLGEDQPETQDRIGDIESEHALERAMERLPERCRRLIDLLYFDSREPSYEEVARQLGTVAAAIGPTRARCLEKLKKLLT